MNYSFDNSTISHSHQALGYFHVGICQNSIHSFRHAHTASVGLDRTRRQARGADNRFFLQCRKAGRGNCGSNTLPWCTAHMDMSSKCSECHPHSWCLACRRLMLRHRDLLSQRAPLCVKPADRESSLLLSLCISFVTKFPPSCSFP